MHNCKFLFILFFLQLTACSSRLDLTPPQLSFVETRVANLSTATGEVRYLIRYQLTNEAPINLFAQIHYQDLSNKSLFRTSSLGGLGQVKTLTFLSTPEDQVINNHFFQITLILYNDAEYTKRLGSHHDLLWFEMPEAVAEILNITLL